MYRVTLAGSKEEAKKALGPQTDNLIKQQNMTEDQRGFVEKIIDAMPDGRLTGTVEDFNNGTVTVSVTSRADFAVVAAASAEARGTPAAPSETDTTKMPGAAGNGAPGRTGQPGASGQGGSPTAQTQGQPAGNKADASGAVRT